MAVWNDDFKNYPKTGEYASVSCVAINEFLLLFKDMFSKEHTWSDADTPTITHVPGQGSVLEFLEDTPVSHSVQGGMQLDVASGELYRDTGVVLQGPVNPNNHGAMIGKADNDHTQYIAVGLTPEVTLLSVGAIEDLDTTPGSYTSDDLIVPKAIHIGNDATTGSKHDDDSITSLPNDVTFGCDKLDDTLIDLFVGTINNGDHVEVNPGCDYVFAPSVLCTPDGITDVGMRAFFTASIAGISDYYPRFCLHGNGPQNAAIAMRAQKVNV